MNVKLLTEQYLEFLSLTGGCTGSSESTLVKIPNCWKSHVTAHIRVPTRQGKVREICFFFKVREKSGNSVKWSGKLENLQKSGKSQGILKSCLVNPSKIEQTDLR